jgi:hypothetical protein
MQAAGVINYLKFNCGPLHETEKAGLGYGISKKNQNEVHCLAN